MCVCVWRESVCERERDKQTETDRPRNREIRTYIDK